MFLGEWYVGFSLVFRRIRKKEEDGVWEWDGLVIRGFFVIR